MNKSYIITGPAGVGKSTISKKVASSLKKSVLIEGDDIYNQFIGGRVSPWKNDAPLDLFWENILMLIDNYLKNGYDVVFNYIIKNKHFSKLKNLFKDYEIRFIVLLVNEITIAKRDKERPLDCQMGERCLILLNEFKNENYDEKYILDSANLTIEDTVKEVLYNRKFTVEKMKLENIKTPNDVFEYMKDNIQYGWLDINNEIHINNTKNCRKLYRTASIEEILEYKIGTCIEQVYLMSYLLNKINVKNKMFCTRIYEDSSFNKLDEEEHIHCFLLYYLNNKVYQIEHPNWKKKGIYKFNSEEEAIDKINEYYINMSDGISRPVTQFFDVEPNLSFKDFNLYINNLDKNKNNDITIIEYNSKYNEDIKDLLVELQEYLVSIDEDHLEILHSDYREKYFNYILDITNKNNGKIYLGLDNNKVVGLIVGEIVRYGDLDYLDYKCPKKGRILELIVNSKYRSKNVGNNLMNSMEKYFKSMGCKYINVEVFNYNHSGINFYCNHNYHTRVIDMIKKI